MNLQSSNQTKLYGLNYYFNELLNLYINNKLPNKILLSGEKGIGKSTMAYHLINYILSQDEDYSYELDDLKINSENRSFKLIQNKSNQNFILIDVIDEKKNIDINQIRNLILTLNKSSFNSKPRFVLIDNIELLNLNSVNALLKILEEPNDNINFILINNNKKILPTLKSRCLNFKIFLTKNQSFEIANRLLKENSIDLFNNDILTYYNTPGQILELINFFNISSIDLKQINLKDLIKRILVDKKYKKDKSIKDLIYSLIELYFRNNVSINNTSLISLYSNFTRKIKDAKTFNLDEEVIFMEFEEKVLNG
jgi:DNA polymerase III subunit delta'